MNFDFGVNAPQSGGGIANGGENAGMRALEIRHRGDMGLLASINGFTDVAERKRREAVQERFQERSAEIAAEEHEKRRQASADLQFQGERLKQICAEEMSALEEKAATANEEDFLKMLSDSQGKIQSRFEDEKGGYQNRQPELNGENFSNMLTLSRDGFAVSARAWYRQKQKTDDVKKAELLGASSAEGLDADGMENAALLMLSAGVPEEQVYAKKSAWELTALKGKIDYAISIYERDVQNNGFSAQNETGLKAGVFDMISESSQTELVKVALKKSAEARFIAARDAYQKSVDATMKAQQKAFDEAKSSFVNAFDDDDRNIARAAYESAVKLVKESGYDDGRKALMLSELESSWARGTDAAAARFSARAEEGRKAIYSRTWTIFDALLKESCGLSEVKQSLSEIHSGLGTAFPDAYGQELDKRDHEGFVRPTVSSESAMHSVALMKAISEYDPKKDINGALLHKFFRDAVGNCTEEDARSVLAYLSWKSGSTHSKPTTLSADEAKNYIYEYLGLTDKKKRDGANADECFAIAMSKLCGLRETLSAQQFYTLMPQIMPAVKRIYDKGENARGMLGLIQNYEAQVYAVQKQMSRRTSGEAAAELFGAAKAAEEAVGG